MAAVPLCADAGVQSLTVQRRTGEPVTIDLSETMTVRFEKGMLLISDEDLEVEIPLSDLSCINHSKDKYNISTGAESVSDVIAAERTMAFTGEEIRLSGFKEGQRLVVARLDGTIVTERIFSGETSLSTAEIGNGVLVISTGNESWKIRINK